MDISAFASQSTDPVEQDWIYGDGEDASKAAYIAKADEIRFVAGPIIQRYLDKQEAERQAIQKAREEAEAARKAEQDAKKGSKDIPEPKDHEMTDADSLRPDSVEEAGNGA